MLHIILQGVLVFIENAATKERTLQVEREHTPTKESVHLRERGHSKEREWTATRSGITRERMQGTFGRIFTRYARAARDSSIE